MKKSIFLFLSIIPLWIRAQTITNVVAKQVGNTIEITYDIDEKADIILMMSENGSNIFSPIPQSVRGDVGKISSPGKGKKMVWSMLADGEHWNLKQARFKVDVLRPKRTLYVWSNEIWNADGVASFSASAEMVFVKGGQFQMGCTPEQGDECDGDEKPAHTEYVSDFYISRHEVDVLLWRAVMEEKPTETSLPGDGLPKTNVSWYAVQEFLRKLNEKVADYLDGAKYTLPTEEQWEYAARGGHKYKSHHLKYSGSNNVDEVAWYELNSHGKIRPAWQGESNALGLNNMSGNAWEWCQNYFTDVRAIRGGCFKLPSRHCRVSERGGEKPSTGDETIGFRLALIPPPSTVAGYPVSNSLDISAHKIPAFSQYAKPIVEKTVNEWQKKDEFEKIADWQKRVNESSRNAKAQTLTKQCERDYIAQYKAIIPLSLSISGTYDSEAEVFTLADLYWGEMTVPVPIAEARIFKDNWALVKITPKYCVVNDKLAIASLDIYLAKLNKHYTYTNPASQGNSTPTVNFVFNPIGE